MTTIQAIEQAVKQLPAHDLAEFRRWFTQFDEAAWDMQIEADAEAGKLDALAAEALAEYRSGKARSGELPSMPGVRWKTQRPDLSKPIAERPVNLGEPLSDWVVANRR